MRGCRMLGLWSSTGRRTLPTTRTPPPSLRPWMRSWTRPPACRSRAGRHASRDWTSAAWRDPLSSRYSLRIRRTLSRSEMAPTDPKLALLGSIPLFSRLGARELQRLGELFDQVDVPAGKVLMRQGQTGGGMFVVGGGPGAGGGAGGAPSGTGPPRGGKPAWALGPPGAMWHRFGERLERHATDEDFLPDGECADPRS